jgi:hypothetical protein
VLESCLRSAANPHGHSGASATQVILDFPWIVACAIGTLEAEACMLSFEIDFLSRKHLPLFTFHLLPQPKPSFNFLHRTSLAKRILRPRL